MLTRGQLYEYCDIVDETVSQDEDDDDESIDEDRERGIRRTVNREKTVGMTDDQKATRFK